MDTEVDEKAPMQWWKSAGANKNDRSELGFADQSDMEQLLR